MAISLARWKLPQKWGKILKVRERLFTTIRREHNSFYMARDTKVAIAVVCLFAALGVVTSVMHIYGGQIRAVTWHMLHGDSATVDGYRIRVPSGWFVEQHSPSDAQWWDGTTGDSIWFYSSPKSPHFTLGLWSQAETRSTRPENPVVGRRELQVQGKSFLCFEHDYLLALPTAQSGNILKQTTHLPSIDCKSSGALDAMFFGGMHAAPQHGYQDFYSVLSSIQKP